MIFFIISIILLLFSIFLFIKTKDKVNNNSKLEKEEKEIQERIDKKRIEEQYAQDKIKKVKDCLDSMQTALNNQKVSFKESLSSYTNLLDYQYQQEEK